jgi:hypothetical protein
MLALSAANGMSAAQAQSLETAYDETLAAYNAALNVVEACSLALDDFQKMMKERRPADDASKEEWDSWAKLYRAGAEGIVACLRRFKSKADELQKKLDALEKQLDAISPEDDKDASKKEPDDKKKKESEDLVRKAKRESSEWNYNIKYKIIPSFNRMNKAASDDVNKNGSGSVKIELNYQLSF